MKNKSVLDEADDIRRAVEMVQLGARMQMLEVETRLSREKLLRIYKEVRGVSPPKGMLPFSTDWFMTWQPNIHASLFHNIYSYLQKTTALDDTDAIIKGYELYCAEVGSCGVEPLLSITRAWRLVRFVDNGLVGAMACSRCGGSFINHPHEIQERFVCGLCLPPARAGKAKRAGTIH